MPINTYTSTTSSSSSSGGGGGSGGDRVAQYRAPAVVSPHRASSASSLSDQERGALLPKARAPTGPAELGGGGGGGADASGSGRAAAAAAGAALQELPHHRRSGSGPSSRAAWTPPPGPEAHTRSGRASPAPKAVPKGDSSLSLTALDEGRKQEQQQQQPAQQHLFGDSDDDDDVEICPTCLERYSDDNPRVRTRCGHSFHAQCVFAWLERSEVCPMCEAIVDFDDGDDGDGGGGGATAAAT